MIVRGWERRHLRVDSDGSDRLLYLDCGQLAEHFVRSYLDHARPALLQSAGAIAKVSEFFRQFADAHEKVARLRDDFPPILDPGKPPPWDNASTPIPVVPPPGVTLGDVTLAPGPAVGPGSAASAAIIPRTPGR